jgi:hypothetical protein
VVIVASEAFEGPARAHYLRPMAAPRGGAQPVRPGADMSASFGPSLRARHHLLISLFTLVTGRKRMDVATYVPFCVGCHNHVLIEGFSQAE